MKPSFKKMLAFNKPTLFRTFCFSLLVIAFFVFTLYILINSPA
jgi:hypothetical protein